MAKQKERYLIFHISGGIGKNITATPIVKALAKKHPNHKIVVVTAYVDPWLYNPYVFRALSIDRLSYFYDTYVKHKDPLIFMQEPYHHMDYILKKRHLVDIWAEMCGLHNFGYAKPDLYFNQREIEFAQTHYANGKYVVLQTNGGAPNQLKYSWFRDIPNQLAAHVTGLCRNEGYNVVHVRREDQLPVEGATLFKGSMRETWLLLKYSSGALLMDSMMQHAAASSAVNKPSTVLWIGNNPDMLGHRMHTNISVKKDKFKINSTHNAVYEPYNLVGDVQDCPFSEESYPLFDIDQVWDSLKEQLV